MPRVLDCAVGPSYLYESDFRGLGRTDPQEFSTLPRLLRAHAPPLGGAFSTFNCVDRVATFQTRVHVMKSREW